MSAIVPSSAQPKPQRSSNIELLRIVAMLLIMFGHLNRENWGLPDMQTLRSFPLAGGLGVWFRMINLTGVDVFVLISGYFGIRPRVNSVASLFFQGLFFSVGMYAFWLLTKQTTFSLGEFSMHLKPMKIYWFFGAYVWLMLIAPIFNRYIDTASKGEFRLFLFVYFFFSCGVEWWMSASAELHRGYSVLSFVGLYLLARYIRLHGGRWCKLSPWYDLLIFVGSTLLSAVSALALVWGAGRTFEGDDPLIERLVSYNSPLCILAALSLLLFFSKLKIGHVRWINWLAASSFSVYLLHEEYITRSYYVHLLPSVGRLYSGIVWGIALIVSVLGIYVAVTLIDQLRLWAWRKIFLPLTLRGEAYVGKKLSLWKVWS